MRTDSRLRAYLGVALVSAGVLALQVIFTRIFSIMIWHHFTYLVVGIALLGGGAAGVFLAVRRWPREVLARRLGPIALLFSLSTLATLFVISAVSFDPLRISDLPRTLFGLAVYFASLFATFLLGGLVIASAFSAWPFLAHRLYFADLLGASVATLAVAWVVQAIGGPSGIVLVALLAALAAAMFGIDAPRLRWAPAAVAVGQAAMLLVFAVRPPQLPAPESKPLHLALALSQSEQPEYTRWNPVARVDVTPLTTIREPMIVGGVSKAHLSALPADAQYRLHFVTLDGTSMTGLYEHDGDLSKFGFLRHAVIAAPYVIGPDAPNTLLIGAGGGIDILLARQYDARRVVAIDLNSDVVDLVTNRYATLTGRLADDANTEVLTAEGRSFLTRTGERFEVIQGIGLDNIAALNSGAYVLSEAYLYTVEAFELALRRLTDDGVFSWTRAATDPPIETLRLTGLAAEALRRTGVAEPGKHIIVVGNDTGDAINLLVSPRPFSPASIAALDAWAAENAFPILHEPGRILDTPYARYLNAPDPRAFERAYAFNIYPVTDDHPFYYNYFKWDRLFDGGARSGNLSARIPIGNLILLAMLGFTMLAALAFVVAPLWRNKRDGLRTPHAASMLVYFGALGVGYMFVQVVLIQRFTLFIGYPTHAITTTIFSMLFFSALGSLVAQRVVGSMISLRAVFAALIALLLLSVLALPAIFDALLGWPDVARVLASIALIAPLAFVMGMPFPTGLRAIGVGAPHLVPWAWGMNGVFSVLGSTLVVLVSMFSSFTASLVAAALFYGVAALASSALSKASVEVQHEYPVVARADATVGR